MLFIDKRKLVINNTRKLMIKIENLPTLTAAI